MRSEPAGTDRIDAEIQKAKATGAYYYGMTFRIRFVGKKVISAMHPIGCDGEVDVFRVEEIHACPSPPTEDKGC